MSNIFTLENISDFSEKLNIDELFERKQKFDLNKLDLYNKILNRIHVRIKLTSRQKIDEPFCWFVVPEVIIGVPKYDQGACLGYIINKLKDNKFIVRYIHPNTLFISWNHWVPSYVRTELKNKTGIIVDEFGNKQDDSSSNDSRPANSLDMLTSGKSSTSTATSTSKIHKDKDFTPIHSYKPHFLFSFFQLLLL